MLQHTSYYVRPEDIVQLPVAKMKGEGLTAVWTITLQQREKKGQPKKTLEVSCGAAITTVMAPGELAVCLSIEGYGNKPEPQ